MSDKEINELEFKLSQYHLFIYGLDIENLSLQEITEDIYHEIKKFFKINKEEIYVIEETSIISKIIIIRLYIINKS